MLGDKGFKEIIFQKYKVKKLIYSSAFSYVYEGINIKDKTPFAIKIEKRNNEYQVLEKESYALMNLKGYGIPKIISYGRHGNYNILVEELLGKSLGAIFEIKKGKFNIKDICMIAIQCIERLKYIHSKNTIHRDIKATNFVIGREDPDVLYLIDFGFSRQYRSSRTGKHIAQKNLKILIGSLKYMSINGNRGFEQSRRDDLESLGYTLIYLAKGTIPWIEPEKKK